MYLREYDFFKALTDLEYTALNGTKVTIPKGEVLIRVGNGLAHDLLPEECIYLMEYQPLLFSKQIELIKDKKEIMTQILLYHDLIIELKTKLTSEVLTHFNIFKEFIEVPKALSKRFRKDIEDIS